MKFRYEDTHGQVTVKTALLATPELMQQCYKKDVEALEGMKSGLSGIDLIACNELIESRKNALLTGSCLRPPSHFNSSEYYWLIITDSETEIEGDYPPDRRKPLTVAKDEIEKELAYKYRCLKKSSMEIIEQ